MQPRVTTRQATAPAGALPPPGTYGLLDSTHYQSSSFNNGDGNAAIPPSRSRPTCRWAAW